MVTFDEDPNDRSVNSLRPKTIFFTFASVPGSYNVGQESCLILEYETQLAEAAIVRYCGSISNVYNPMNTGQHQLPA